MGSAAAAVLAGLAGCGVPGVGSSASPAGTAETQYFKSDYDYTEDGEKKLQQAQHDLYKQLVGEGTVLLKNEGQALPLSTGDGTVNVFGNAGPQYIEMFDEAFKEAGFQFNDALWDFYANGSQNVTNWVVNENPWSSVEGSGALDGASGVAVVVLGRRGREASDNRAEDGAGDYLAISAEEEEMLNGVAKLRRDGTFSKMVVLMNTTNTISWKDAAWQDAIDALVWCGSYFDPYFRAHEREWAIDPLVGVLKGDFNPSGRMTDSIYKDNKANPVMANFGKIDADLSRLSAGKSDEVQRQIDKWKPSNDKGSHWRRNYVYAEGIYVGYRYYETRYEDVVLGQGNAGDFDYAGEVCYPFGYGLSYTTFDWSGFKTSWSGKACTATVTVKNTGDVAGRDVVELYAQSPYTDYDRANGVEKSAVQLVGYAKTKLLEPGESQEVSVTFDESELKTYDSEGAGTYILDAGTYYVTAAHDSHDAVNNVLAAKGASGTDAAGNKSLVDTYVPANADVDATTYATDSLTGEKIENELSDARGDVTYLTRADWEGTFPTHDGEPTSQVSTWGNEINGDDGASYTYGKTASADLLAKLDATDSGNPDVQGWDGELTYGASNGLQLIDLRGLDYDDPKWSDLLDQLTPDDYETMILHAGYGTDYVESVGKPAGTDADSTSGWSWGGTGMTFCNPMTVAQTWNQEIAYRLGNMIGNESLLGGATGWYAPAMNIHRTPYSGRNGEYFSEDSFLSGAMASQEVKGAAEKGVYTMMKHFAFNEQENHRGDRNGQYSMATWMNEQSARELYLKPFETCMKVGDVELNYLKQNGDGTYENATRKIRACQGLMTAFNRIGTTWVGGSYNLISGIVRGEWGFDGFIITDNADTGVFMNGGQMIQAGADAKLTVSDPTATWSFDSSDPVTYRYAREAVHHLLYTMANGHSMNGAMHGSKFVTGGATGLQKADLLRYGLTAVGVAGIAIVAGVSIALEVRRRKR